MYVARPAGVGGAKNDPQPNAVYGNAGKSANATVIAGLPTNFSGQHGFVENGAVGAGGLLILVKLLGQNN